ncbi:MAG TPA: amidohydrolase family protein, partial [Candidatus Kapabacteria bacterium]|nr:amidohydrolase family protein [Candidatus Kapabacteria bacterium]
MATLIKNISSLVTINADGKPYKCGEEMSDIGEIQNGAILFDEKILFVGTTDDALRYIYNNHIQVQETIDASGKTVLPGFVDSHTHFVFAGNRSFEFARRLRGVTYQQIAKEGGGILTTMKATRQASLDELVANGLKLANSALRYGTTTVEIKSGYGLSFDSEIRQLEAIAVLKEIAHQNVV